MQKQAGSRQLPVVEDNPISLQMKQSLDQEELANCMRVDSEPRQIRSGFMGRTTWN